MKNKYIIIGLIIILILIIGGICFMLFNNKKVKIGDIKTFNFSYSNGYAMNAYIRYEIDEESIATVKPYLVPDEEALKVKVDDKTKAKLKEILEKYEVGKWNGFNKNDKNVLDGDSFSLSVSFLDNSDISAHGYMKWPNNYHKVRDEFDNLFTEVIKDETITWSFINRDISEWIAFNKEYRIHDNADTLKVLGNKDNLEYELVIDGTKLTDLTNDKYKIDILDTRDDSVKVKISRKEN